MTGRQGGSSPHDLLKREPFPFRKETSHTEWNIVFRVLLEKVYGGDGDSHLES